MISTSILMSFGESLLRYKLWSNLYLNKDSPKDIKIDVEIIANQNETSISRVVDNIYKDLIYVSTTNTISMLDKINFNTLVSSTTTGNKISYLRIFEDTLYGIEKDSGSILRINANDLTLIDKTTRFANNETFNGVSDLSRRHNDIFIADTWNNRVLKFNQDMIFVSSSVTSLSSPTAVAYDGSNVYVFDANNQRIIKFGKDLNYIMETNTNNQILARAAQVYPIPRLKVTDKFLISAYAKYPIGYSFTTLDVVGSYIQIRDKVDMKILKEKELKDNVILTQIFDMDADDKYIYVSSSYTSGGVKAISLQKVSIDNLDFVSGTNQFGHIDSIAVSGYSPTSGVDKIPLGVQ